MPKYRIRVERESYIDESPREWDNVATMVCWHGRYTLGDEQPLCDPTEYRLDKVHDLDSTGLLQALGDYFFNDPLSCTMTDVRTMVRDTLHNIRNSYRPRAEASEAWALYREAQAIFAEGDVADYARRLWDEHFISLPLNLYDHSGITMSTGSFSCPWDSGQVGFIYVTRERALAEWGPAHEPQKESDDEFWRKRLNQEVEVYDQYLTGDVYNFVVERAEPYVRTYANGNTSEGEDWDSVDCCGGFYLGDGYKDLAAAIGDHVSAPTDVVETACDDIGEWHEWESDDE